MKHWEFLLQKEGDRSWLPLDSPDVEILEGRYRIVARSNNANTEIEIRIVHLATEAVPPKRRVQKRSCRTNQEGLMVVIPFTQLEPGLWELHCSPADLMTDLMAGAQPYSVKLQVLARDAEEEDWEPDWSSPTTVTAVHVSTEEPSTVVTSASTADIGEPVVAIAKPSAPSLNSLSQPAATDDQPIALQPEVAEILSASMDRLFQIAEQMSEQLVDDVLQDFDLSAIADAPAISEPETLDRPPAIVQPAATGSIDADSTDAESIGVNGASPSAQTDYTLAADEAFLLTLHQTALIAIRGEVLTLSGRVAIEPHAALTSLTSPSPSSIAASGNGVIDPWELEEHTLDLTGAIARNVELCLRDPQSLKVLVSDRQSLPPTLPFDFTFSFSLPDNFSTHLVLGEVVLYGSFSTNADRSIALTTQAFSITVDPTELVGELTKLNDALTAEIEDEERIDLPLELASRVKEQDAAPLNLSFLNLVVAEPSTEQPPRFPSLAGQPLPPQIYRPDPESVRHKTLDLPAFTLISQTISTVTPASDAATQAEQDVGESTPETIAAPASPETATAQPDDRSVPDNEVQAAVSAAPSELVGAIVPAPMLPESTELIESERVSVNHRVNQPPLDLPSPTNMAFQSLNLQDRFLTRLTSLATDVELSALLRANLAPGSPATPLETTVVPSPAEARSLSDEIVVDDDLPLRDRRRPVSASTTDPQIKETLHEQMPVDSQPNPLLLPTDDPVPVPALDVTTGELVAGKAINIRVKLPNLLPRIYVKLWLTDRQTRSLLDGPRWLVDFLPNGLGDLEAMTPLTVPFGSLEIRFEAIAVEMHTQRESHKVTIDRSVVPPNLPIVSLDDFHA